MRTITVTARRRELAAQIERLTNQVFDLDILLDDQRRDVERTESSLSAAAAALERANAEYDAIAARDDSDDDDRPVDRVTVHEGSA